MNINASLARNKLLSILGEETLVEEYVEKFGYKVNILNIKKIKAEQQEAPLKSSDRLLQSPLYRIKVRCPVCKQPDIDCFELKAKSQAITFDRFMTPKYEGTGGFETVDYSQFAVTVCPRCLFASPDKKDFITYSLRLKAELPSQLGPMVLKRLEEEIFTRKESRQTDSPEKFFKVPRNLDAVVASYELAMQRAVTEMEFELQHSHYKAGAYALRAAMNLRRAELPEEKFLEKALTHFTDCFIHSNVANQDLENQVMYTIVALSIRLQKEKQAQEYIQVIDKIKTKMKQKQKEDPTIKLTSIEKWEKDAKMLWEDRDRPDLWNH